MRYLFCSVMLFALGIFVSCAQSLMYEECVKKTGATQNEQAPVLHYEPPTTRNGQCLLACLMKKEGLITQENKINTAMLYKDIQDEKKSAPEIFKIKSNIYENCTITDIQNSDECIVAKEFAYCVYPKEIAAGVQKFIPYDRRTN